MNVNLQEVAESLLGRKVTKKDGIRLSEIESIEKLLGVKIPSILKDFYLLVGNVEMFMSSFEQFIEPYLKDGMLIFLEENQGCCYWAVNTENTDNPNVFMCTHLESENPQWVEEKVSLLPFILILLYYQCAQGGYKYSATIDEGSFESREKYLHFLYSITADYQKVVEHNGLVIYQHKRKLIWYFMDRDNNVADTIFASAQTKKEMKVLEVDGFQEL